MQASFSNASYDQSLPLSAAPGLEGPRVFNRSKSPELLMLRRMNGTTIAVPLICANNRSSAPQFSIQESPTVETPPDGAGSADMSPLPNMDKATLTAYCGDTNRQSRFS